MANTRFVTVLSHKQIHPLPIKAMSAKFSLARRVPTPTYTPLLMGHFPPQGGFFLFIPESASDDGFVKCPSNAVAERLAIQNTPASGRALKGLSDSIKWSAHIVLATDCLWENDLIAGSRRDKRGVGSGQLQIEACTLPREFWGRLNAFVPLSPESDEQVAEVKPIKPEQIDALIPFLDKFEEAGFSAGDWKVDEGPFVPWFIFDESVMEFIEVLDDNDWVTPQFDWGEWKESAKRYIESREMVESADAVTIQKLLTTHVRADRFCEGHLGSMFENGHIVAILRRLKVIRDGVE